VLKYKTNHRIMPGYSNAKPKRYTGGRVGNPAWGRKADGTGRSGYEVTVIGKLTEEQMREYERIAKENGWMDPVSFQHMVMSDQKLDLNIRLQAASNISKFFYPMYGNKPVHPDPHFYTDKLEYPNPTPTTIAQVRENINHLTQLKNAGKVDTDRADNLIADQRTLHDSLVDEAKLLTAQGEHVGEQTIHITGGLPELPGTNITMPELNGRGQDLLMDPNHGLKDVSPDNGSSPGQGSPPDTMNGSPTLPTK
jgi:hypothetical protein